MTTAAAWLRAERESHWEEDGANERFKAKKMILRHVDIFKRCSMPYKKKDVNGRAPRSVSYSSCFENVLIFLDAQFVMELLVPELQKEMEDVVGWFNENAQKLPDSKCLTWFKGNTRKTSHLGLIQEGKRLG
ncbi:hypothetical protein Bca52824_079798 [Brassica carinata]|uniref:Uncharacterized protein n=1 Tax=Brassica carinata TaxID=52824 RepID=A0A8X7U0G2_BRACI|nr:hypothetical protein Bca52824_079798 [Brassica carinata]